MILPSNICVILSWMFMSIETSNCVSIVHDHGDNFLGGGNASPKSKFKLYTIRFTSLKVLCALIKSWTIPQQCCRIHTHKHTKNVDLDTQVLPSEKHKTTLHAD